MKYRWLDVAVFWATFEQDYEFVDNVLHLYKPEALQGLVAVCDLLRGKADKVYFEKQDARKGK